MIKFGDLTLYSVKEVADKFGISVNTVQRYLKEGKIAGQKMGKSWYISEPALNEFFLKTYKETKNK